MSPYRPVVDIAYYPAASLAAMPDECADLHGPPVLAIEIISPGDTHGHVVQQVRMCLTSGVDTVWIVDPDLQQIFAHRTGRVVQAFTKDDEVPGDPELPGFRMRVADLFHDV
jgi:Uma2 family endonuclease